MKTAAVTSSVLFSLVLMFATAGGCGQSPSPAPVAPPPAATQPVSNPVYLPVSSDPTVSYRVWFQVGSQDDPAGKEGLAWLTGQLLAEGSTTEHSFRDIIAKLFPMAASYDIRVDREMTTLRGRAHRDHGAAFHRLFADAYLRPAFAADDLERIRNRGLSYLEKTLRYASDEELGKAALYDFVFADTRYRHPTAGTVAGLKAITVEDVKAFYHRHYTRDRVVFGLGGGYGPDTAEALSATRGELPAGSAAQQTPAPKPAPFTGRHVMLVAKANSDASISFGFPIDVRRGQKDFYALWIATSWLGEHRNSSSHLYQIIRAARGLNYGDYAYIEAFPEGGFRQMPPTNVARRQQLFEVWIRTLPNDKAVFALRAALRELRLLVDNGMTEQQFELTRTFLRKYIRHFAPTTQAQLGYALDDRFYGIEEGHFSRFLRMMDELTLADVNRAIKTHLQYRDLKIAMVTGEAESIRKALVSGAPSQIQYDVPKPDRVLAQDKTIVVEPLDIRAENVRVVPVETMFQR
ncbi:MAG: insulinase family protein [Proteobacteria bacterium]|nr:insulinase family protein [Pseudomonadota bacterium]